MDILIMFIIIVFASLLIFLGESFRERSNFEVTKYEVQSKKLHKLKCDKKIVVLSDLHNKNYKNNNIKIIETIRYESPDIIIIAGDMIIGKPETSTLVASELLKELVKIAPVYYGNGNHEQRMKDYPQKYGDLYKCYKNELVKYGVIFLENKSIAISFDDLEVSITGLEIPHEYYRHQSSKLLSLQEMHDCIDQCGAEYQILIAHNPAHIETYKEWGADLILSGHLHGGIVRVPFLGGVITPQIHLFPKYDGGIYREDGSTAVVSRGIGEHTINIRFLNKPELVVLNLKSNMESS